MELLYINSLINNFSCFHQASYTRQINMETNKAKQTKCRTECIITPQILFRIIKKSKSHGLPSSVRTSTGRLMKEILSQQSISGASSKSSKSSLTLQTYNRTGILPDKQLDNKRNKHLSRTSNKKIFYFHFLQSIIFKQTLRATRKGFSG